MSTVEPVNFEAESNAISLLADENIDPITFSVILIPIGTKNIVNGMR